MNTLGGKIVSRVDKFMPGAFGTVSVYASTDKRITVFAWEKSPVELWIWDFNVGGYGGSRIELRGLEHYPSREQLEPALALYMGMREYQRRVSGGIAGPGRPRTGMSDETKRRYLALVNQFWGSDLSRKEFCKEKGISPSKLVRAAKYAESVKKTD
jgi:hypothetical protein